MLNCKQLVCQSEAKASIVPQNLALWHSTCKAGENGEGNYRAKTVA